MGLHPNSTNVYEPSVDELIELAELPEVVAVGETGLDYYRSEGDLDWQQQRLRRHIRAACEVGKPLIIHSRNARDETIKILKEEKAQEVGGVLHCFTETLEMAKQAIDLGFYISFSGILTFKNAIALQEVAKALPLERILIETDCPYLAPMPFRGKPNQPAYVRYVAECLSELRGLPIEEVARVTTDNFFNCFSLCQRGEGV